MIEQLRNKKKVLLIEPTYERKYIPLGLAKIATYIKENGGVVRFARYYDIAEADLICITSLFTYYIDKVYDVLDSIRFTNDLNKVLLGGIAATLLHDTIKENYPEITIFKGYSQELDCYKPDYSIDWQVEKPWDEYSFIFTSRGCVNNCGYCAVKRLENEQWINPKWKECIDFNKPCIMVSDNNLSATPKKHINDVLDYLYETKKKIIFDNGLDCKYITDEIAKKLARLKYTRDGMRLAFDRIEEDGIFQKAVKKLLDAGVSKHDIMVYVLFNFKDDIQEANYRMIECVKLGIRPYPQTFVPLNHTNKNYRYLNKNWTMNLIKVFRRFWLLKGIYTKNNFFEWVHHNSKKYKYKLDEKDLELLNKGK